MPDIHDTIRHFIIEQYLPGESPENLPNDMPLQSSGLLDSLATLNLASFVQQRFGIEFDASEVTAERFDSIDAIAASIRRKQDQHAPAPSTVGAGSGHPRS